MGAGESYVSVKSRVTRMMRTMVLGVGLLAGAPLSPAEIEELLAQAAQTKVVEFLRQEAEDEEEKTR